jgi:hypothetical protein
MAFFIVTALETSNLAVHLFLAKCCVDQMSGAQNTLASSDRNGKRSELKLENSRRQLGEIYGKVVYY